MRYLTAAIILSILFTPVTAFSQTSDSDEKFQIISYSPYRDGHGPNGLQPSISDIQNDMEILGKITDNIRLYHLPPTLTEDIVREAKNHAINVHVSIPIDISSSRIQFEVGIVSDLLIKYNNIKSVIFDKTIRGSGDILTDNIPSYTRQLKQDSPITISAATDYGEWDKNKSLVDKVDYIILSSFPYWSGLAVDDAINTSIANQKELENKYGKKIILETGWPSDGDTIDCSIPNNTTQANFVIQLLQSTEDYILFTAFSENWKGKVSHTSILNEQCSGLKTSSKNAENHWGIFNVDRKINPTLFSESISKWIEEDMYEVPEVSVTDTSQCDLLFEPDIPVTKYDVSEDSLKMKFRPLDKDKSFDILILDKIKNKSVQEIRNVSEPITIIIESTTDFNVFDDTLIGVNCVGDIDVNAFATSEKIAIGKIEGFELTTHVTPTAFAVCGEDELCQTIIIEQEDYPIFFIIAVTAIVVIVAIVAIVSIRRKIGAPKKNYFDPIDNA